VLPGGAGLLLSRTSHEHRSASATRSTTGDSAVIVLCVFFVGHNACRMLQAALAGFCGGAWVGHQCGTCEMMPSLRCDADNGYAFRISVRILSASVPKLAAGPGLLVRQRPRAEVSFSESSKETELAQFSGSSSRSQQHSPDWALQGGAAASVDCPWSFGDTLIFTACLADVHGPGLKVRLRSQSDVSLGPMRLELAQLEDIGSCRLDLRRWVLPACLPERLSGLDGLKRSSGGKVAATGCRIWESPVLVIPLANEKGIAAHVALEFGVTADPAMLLRLARDSERPLAEKVVRLVSIPGLKGCTSCATAEHAVVKCSPECSDSSMHECSLPEGAQRHRGKPQPICQMVHMQAGQQLNMVSKYRATAESVAAEDTYIVGNDE